MVIKNIKPLNMQEVKKLLGKIEESEESTKKKQVGDFVKKFSKIKKDKAEGMKKELTELGMIKIKEKNIAKIIDILPEDSKDLNKIITDVSLTEDEANKILEIVKKHK
jgi:DNA-directed RNA polymerase subunit F